jgi:Pyruvate/2-oxoacid:ferredoxin oxidoreductase gamma subunit
MIGALSKHLEFKEEDWEKAITTVVKEKFLEKNLEKNLEMNMKAFKLGRSM